MTIPKKIYDIMKFLIGFIPYVVTILSGACMTFGVGDSVTNKIIFCVGAVASICDAAIKVASKLHWKAIATDGKTEEITADDTESTEEITGDTATSQEEQ